MSFYANEMLHQDQDQHGDGKGEQNKPQQKSSATEAAAEVANTFSNGTFVTTTAGSWVLTTKSGRAFSGETVASARLAKPLLKAIRVVNAMNFVGTGIMSLNDISQGHYKTAAARILISAAATGAIRVPYVGFLLSTAIGVGEATYGDRLYNYLETGK